MTNCFDPSWPRGSAPSVWRPGWPAVSPQAGTELANSGYCCPPLARAENPNWHEAAKGVEETSGEEKSTDPGLSAAERKTGRADQNSLAHSIECRRFCAAHAINRISVLRAVISPCVSVNSQ